MSATKTVEPDREKVISIISKTLESEIGSEVFIPCASKKAQKDFHTCIVRELKTLSTFDPSAAASITHRTLFRDGRFWVSLIHIEPTLNTIYIKSKGTLSKIDI